MCQTVSEAKCKVQFQKHFVMGASSRCGYLGNNFSAAAHAALNTGDETDVACFLPKLTVYRKRQRTKQDTGTRERKHKAPSTADTQEDNTHLVQPQRPPSHHPAQPHVTAAEPVLSVPCSLPGCTLAHAVHSPVTSLSKKIILLIF